MIINSKHVGGGITPTGKITIIENGTDIDVAQYALADVNVSGGVTPVGTYITHHEVVTIQSAFTGTVVAFEDALMELAGLQGKNFAYFAQKPKENYIYNDWYCAAARYMATFLDLGSTSSAFGFRYRDGWTKTQVTDAYDAAAEAGSVYDVYAIEWVGPTL